MRIEVAVLVAALLYAIWEACRPRLSPAQRKHRREVNSPQWAARREDYYRDHPRVCAAIVRSSTTGAYRVCGARKPDLHHLRYPEWPLPIWSVPDDWLIPLCRRHHRIFDDLRWLIEE